MIDVKLFEKILSDLIKSESGIRKVILVDRTGLTIAHASKFSYYPVDIDGIGAIASAVFVASEEQGKNLDIGELMLVTSEFEQGKIFAASCGKGVLCVITDSDVNIGMVRLLMKRAATELEKVLDEFLSEQTTLPATEEKTREKLKSALDKLEEF
ncbi:MAG: roadblock/LC7 domain-containing protein [Candidatus Baldrarchaeia archaeon]|nr:roadblock/LC7 domain-containing protein [Candidatus Odinarchaeota archaeon]